MKFKAAPLLHDQRVTVVQEQVKRWSESGLRGKKTMCTARKEWLTMSVRTSTFKNDCNRIKCDLRDILSIDTDKKVIRTEPLVNMRYMTAHLVPLGYQLAIQVDTKQPPRAPHATQGPHAARSLAACPLGGDGRSDDRRALHGLGHGNQLPLVGSHSGDDPVL